MISAKWVVRFSGAVAVIAGLMAVSQCAPSSSQQGGRQNALGRRRGRAEGVRGARRPRPDHIFASGGHSGQVYVYGVPSMRHISTIPVFTPYPATGYGFDDESKKMLGNLTWGDVHHPALSETNGDYDGRWLFVNEMNGRVARIDLRDFKTKQILGPVPNVSGQPRFVLRHAEHRVHDDGLPLLDPAPEGHVRAGRQVRHRLQGRARRHQDRSEEPARCRSAGRS